MINTDHMQAAIKLARKSAQSRRLTRIQASYKQAASDAIAAGASLEDASGGDGLHFVLTYKGLKTHVFTQQGAIWSEPEQGIVMKLRGLGHPWDLADVVRAAVDSH